MYIMHEISCDSAGQERVDDVSPVESSPLSASPTEWSALQDSIHEALSFING